MNILIVTDDHGVPLAAYSDKRAHDAAKVADIVGGNVSRPFTLNRDIPADGKAMFRVELTKDGNIRGTTRHTVREVFEQNIEAGWSVYETPRRWRLNVHVWAKEQADAETEARMIFLGVTTGKRQRSGTL